MLFNTVPLSDCRDVENSLLWLNQNANTNSCLVTHTAFYGWALLYLENNFTIKTYGFGFPDNSARSQSQQGFIHIYLIWWVNGSGLHGQPTSTWFF